MDNISPGQENPAAPIKNIDVSFDENTSLDDIASKYTQIGSDYNQFVENSYNNVMARQAEHIGNDFGGSPYNFHTYYEPGASDFASAMRQTGTQQAFTVGMERGKAEAEANLAAAKNNYSNAVAAQNTMAEQYNQTKGDPLVSTIDESLLPNGVTAEEFANAISTSDDPWANASAVVNAGDLTSWVKNWDDSDIAHIANQTTGSFSPELQQAWKKAKAAGRDSDEWNRYFARSDVSRIWSDAYAVEWAKRNLNDDYAAWWGGQAQKIQQLGQAIVDIKNGTFDWATQNLIPREMLSQDNEAANLDINILDVASIDLNDLKFNDEQEINTNYDIKLLNKDNIVVNGTTYSADAISEIIKKGVGIDWSWADLKNGTVTDDSNTSFNRNPQQNTDRTKKLIIAAFERSFGNNIEADSLKVERSISLRSAIQAATGVTPEEFRSISDMQRNNPDGFQKLSRSVSSAIANASIFELADGTTQYHTAEGYVTPSAGTVVMNVPDAVLDKDGNVKDKALKKLVEIYSTIDDPTTLDADTEKAYKDSWAEYVKHIASYRAWSSKFDNNVSRDLYNAILYNSNPEDKDYSALSVGNKSAADFIAEFKSLTTTDREKAQAIFGALMEKGMECLGGYFASSDGQLTVRSLKTEDGQELLGRFGIENGFDALDPQEALAAAVVISASMDQYNQNKNTDTNIDPSFMDPTFGETIENMFTKTVREIGKDIELVSGLFGAVASMGRDAIFGGNTADKEAMKVAAAQGDFSAYMKEMMKDWKTLNIVGDDNMSELFFGDYKEGDYGYENEMRSRMMKNLREAVNPMVDAVWFGEGEVTAFGDKSATKNAAVEFVENLLPIVAAGYAENAAANLLDAGITAASKRIMAGGIKNAKNGVTVALSSDAADDLIETYTRNAAEQSAQTAAEGVASLDDFADEALEAAGNRKILKPSDIAGKVDDAVDAAKATVNTVKATGYEDILGIASTGGTNSLNSYYKGIIEYAPQVYKSMGDILAERLLNELTNADYKAIFAGAGLDVSDTTKFQTLVTNIKDNASKLGTVMAESAYQRATVAAFTGKTVETVAAAGNEVQRLANNIISGLTGEGVTGIANSFIRDSAKTLSVDDVAKMLGGMVEDSSFSALAGRGAFDSKQAIRYMAANGWEVKRSSLIAQRIAKSMASNTVEDIIRGYIKPTIGPEGETQRTTMSDYFSNPMNFITPLAITGIKMGIGAGIRRISSARLASKIDKAQAALLATEKSDPTYPAKLQKLLNYSDKARKLTTQMLDKSLSYTKMKEVSDEASGYLKRELDGFFNNQGFDLEPIMKNTTLSKNVDFQKYVAGRAKPTDLLFQSVNITYEQAMAKVGRVRQILHMDDNVDGTLGKIKNQSTLIKFWSTLNDVAEDEKLINSVKKNLRLKSFDQKNAVVRKAQVDAVVDAFSAKAGKSNVEVIPGLKESVSEMLNFFDEIGNEMVKRGQLTDAERKLGFLPTAAFLIGSADDDVPAALRGIWVNTESKGVEWTTPDPTAKRDISMKSILEAFANGDSSVERVVNGEKVSTDLNVQGLDPFTATMAYFNSVNLHYNTGKVLGDSKTSVGAAAIKGNYAVIGGQKAAVAAATNDLKINKARQEEINKILKDRLTAEDSARIRAEVAEGKKMERLLKDKEGLTAKIADAKVKVGQQEATIERIQQEIAEGRKPVNVKATVGEVLGVTDDSEVAAIVKKAKLQIEDDIKAVQAGEFWQGETGEDLSGIATDAGRIGARENPYYKELLDLQKEDIGSPDIKKHMDELMIKSNEWDRANYDLARGKVKVTKGNGNLEPTVSRSATYIDMVRTAARNGGNYDYDLVVRRAIEDYNFRPVAYEKGNISGLENTLDIKPANNKDVKAAVKGRLSNKFIGFSDGIAGSSTGNYAKQAGNMANTGSYADGDVVFMSVVGKRGTDAARKANWDKTVQEAKLALDNGAVVVADNADYIKSSKYNIGEAYVADKLKASGYAYADIQAQGQRLGVWYSKDQATPKFVFENEVVFSDIDEQGDIKDYTRRQLSYLKPDNTEKINSLLMKDTGMKTAQETKTLSEAIATAETYLDDAKDEVNGLGAMLSKIDDELPDKEYFQQAQTSGLLRRLTSLSNDGMNQQDLVRAIGDQLAITPASDPKYKDLLIAYDFAQEMFAQRAAGAGGYTLNLANNLSDIGDDEDLSDLAQNNVITDMWGKVVDEGSDMKNLTTNRLMDEESVASIPKMLRQYVVDVEDREQMKAALESFNKVITGLTDKNSVFYDKDFARAKDSRSDIMTLFSNAKKDFAKAITDLAKTDTETKELVDRAVAARQARQSEVKNASAKLSDSDYLAALGIARSGSVISKSKNPTQYAAAATAFDTADSNSLVSKIKNIAAMGEDVGFAPTTLAYMRQNIDGIYGDDVNSMINYLASTPQGMYRQYRAALSYLDEKGVDTSSMKKELKSIADALGLRGGVKYNDDLTYSNEQTLDQELSTFLTEVPNKSSWLNKLKNVVDYNASEDVPSRYNAYRSPEEMNEFKAMMQREQAYHSGSFYDMFESAKAADAEEREATSGSPVKVARDLNGQIVYYYKTPAELQEEAWLNYLTRTPDMSDARLESDLQKAIKTLNANKNKVAELESAVQELDDGTRGSVKKANNKSKAQKSVEKILGKELYKELEDLKTEEKNITNYLSNKKGIYHAKNGAAYVGDAPIMSNYVRLEDARTALGATDEGFTTNADDKAARKAMIKELKKGNKAASNRVGTNLSSNEKLEESGLLKFRPSQMDDKSRKLSLANLTEFGNDVNKYVDNSFIDSNKVYVDKDYLDLLLRFSDKPLSGTSKTAQLATALSNFSQEVQNFQLAGGWGAYNALTLAQLRSAMLENPAKAKQFIGMFADIRNSKSSMHAVQGNIDLLTEIAYQMKDPTVTMDLAYVMSNDPGRNDGGVLQNFASKILARKSDSIERFPKGIRNTISDDIDMIFEDPTFKQALPVMKAQMYAMNYDAARSNINKVFAKELSSGAMTPKEAHDAAIELAYVQTQKFWSPEKFWRNQFDNSSALDRIYNQRLRDFIGQNITGEGSPTTFTDLLSNAFFALRYKQTFVNRAAQGGNALLMSPITQMRDNSLQGYLNSSGTSRLATSMLTLMGISVLAKAWCDAVGVPDAWSDFTFEPQGNELIHIPSALQKWQNVGQIWIPNSTDENGNPKVDPNKRAMKLDTMFSMWTLPNTAMRALNKTLNSQADDYAAPQRGLPLLGTNSLVNKAVNSNVGRAITDEVIGSNLLSPLKAMHEVLINSTYYGNNIWERKYLPNGKENPNYDPARNVTASIFHVIGWDKLLDPNGYNRWVKGADVSKSSIGKLLGGQGMVKQDQIGTIAGSGIWQHEYLTGVKKMMEGDYASALVEAGELPFKFETLSSKARTELNALVKNTLAHYGTQYKSAIEKAKDNDAKDEAYAAYVKKSADAISQWSAKYDYVLGENQELVAYATRMLMAMTAGEYDDDMAYLQNAYWKATQIAQIESTDNLFFKDDDLAEWIANGGSAEDFYEEKNRRSAAYNQALDDEYEARQALRKAGYSDKTLEQYSYEDLRAAQRTASKKIYAEIQSKLSKPTGEFDNFDDMKSYYEEMIDNASTTKQKAKLAEKYNQQLFDVIAPYVDKYGAALLTDTKIDNSGLAQKLSDYVIIPADQKYYGKTPRASYLKDYFGVGYRNKTNLPSDEEVRKKFARAIEYANKGSSAAANSMLDGVIKRINSGELYASDEDYNKIIRLKALTKRSK